MLTSDVKSFVRASLPPPPARVLEVGAGDGELAEALTAGGYDVVAIDPASTAANVRAVALHELREPPASFDHAVAVLSLHHVEPLAESCRRLAELVRHGGTLVVDEFDVERFDERAARWQATHRERSGQHVHAPAEDVAYLRAHLHPLATLRQALGEWFELSEPVRGPYLHRWELPPGLRGSEEDEIAAGSLPATGARLVGKRK